MNTERYARQMMLAEFGEQGQERLRQAHIVVVGAGGLGSPVLTYLAAAGVGRISVFDPDVVSVTNLHRQILYRSHQVGESKAEIAAEQLCALNPDVTMVPYAIPFAKTSDVEKVVAECDVVIDCTDSFATRYDISDLCELHHRPMVYGAITALSGQVAVLCHPDGHATYRTLFPTPTNETISKAVLGPTPGVIGSVQALQAIKLIVGMEGTLIDRLWQIDLETMSSFTFEL